MTSSEIRGKPRRWYPGFALLNPGYRLRAELEQKGMTIESSSVKDAYGFRYQRLKELRPVASMTIAELLAASKEVVREFDRV